THSNKELFTLPISAVLLDPNKWYAELTPEGNSYTPAWPAGTVHGANVTGSYKGSINDPVWYITSSDATDNLFISPKVKATANETLTINASLGGYYDTGIINVYVAESRKALEEDATRTKVATLDGTTDDQKLNLTSALKACEVSMPAGEYYVGLEIKEQACINYLYGLSPVAVDNDINIVNVEIPSTVMQNSRVELKAKLHNYAPQIVNGEDYKVAAYIDGVKVVEAEGIELPCATSYADTPAEVSVPVRFPKVGNSSVRLDVSIGNTTLSSDDVQVEVTPEVVNSEMQIGVVDRKGYNDAPLNILYANSETVMLYTPDQLGLENGESISGITFKGFMMKSDFKTDLKLAYALVDNSSISQPSGEYDLSSMNVALDQEDFEWKVEGSTNNPTDLINVNLPSPLVYEEGKALLVYISSKSSTGAWASSSDYGWQATDSKSNCFSRATDGDISTYSWELKYLPVLYLSLTSETVEVSGVVYDEGEAVEGAVVTFVSADGENVQYTSTTDATGAYSVNLIQNTRSYNVTAAANGKEDFLSNQSFDSSVDNLDFDLLNVVEIDNLTGNTHTPDAGALVKLNLQLDKGFNTIVLPFDVTADEMQQLFGDDAVVAEFSHSTLAEGSDELKLIFEQTTSMEAGKPYLIHLVESPEPVIYRGKEVVEHLNHSVDKNANANFHATYEARTLAADEVLLSKDNFVSGRMRQVVTASPYSAYVKITNPAVKSVSFTVDGDIVTGIEEVITDGFGENDVIYNLQGVGVKNPEKGIYIVNGKKIVVK
ncbi:MAG: carboxypeptidase-like regulatory domain-containing protein, partial [Muribaculaceae bacterium]|nr:carboxypeptidase-like regulatory domain-containing protein [Muribaculaceae bacterium]